jgi:hypothetical protein
VLPGDCFLNLEPNYQDSWKILDYIASPIGRSLPSIASITDEDFTITK